MKELLKQVKQYKKDSVLAPVYSALEVVMEVIIPFVMALLIDEGVEKGNMNKILLYGIIMIVLAMISLFAGMMAGKYAASASSGFACNLREAMYRNIQRFSFSNIDKFSTAGLVTRMTTDVTNVQNAYQMIIRIAVRAPLMLISSMAMCFVVNADMSFIFLGAIVFLAAVLVIIMLRAMKIFNVAFTKYDDLNASVQENISGIRVVKSYVREDYENEKFKKASGNLYNMFKKAESTLAFNNPVMMLVIYACIMAICWFGAKFIVVDKTLQIGELTSLFSYVMGSLMSLMMLSMIFVMITMSVASMRRITEVLREQPDLAEPFAPVELMSNGSIDFDNVHFRYHKTSEEEVLTDINLHIKSGETIGIIGGTGCGKTSLVNLISRLYDVQQGSVKVGGVDVKDYDMKFLRDQVSVVLQKNVLFSGTILDNLRWGNENATEEECIEACKWACADEFIERFPDKYNTVIERGGTNVSGGQKQRISIARVFLKNPPILILDEATSALDNESERYIQKSLEELAKNRTTITIAHRLSTIKRSDEIIVITEDGIAERGTHETLLAKNGIYARYYNL